MIWLSSEDFERRFEKVWKPGQVYWSDALGFSTGLQELRESIGSAGVDNPPGSDWPGPVVCWYGELDGQLLSWVHYVSIRQTILWAPDLRSEQRPALWQMVQHFPKDSFPFVWPVSWIRGHKEAVASVCRENALGITNEVYRAASRKEAQELLDYLSEQCALGEYYLAEPEALDVDWIVERELGESPLKIVARYGNRSSAENVAWQMSQADEGIFAARQEHGPRLGLAFEAGRRIRGAR